jgi:hypothetical protein
LNSPILWESNNSDKSDRGRERAIPAQYVNAVFEVKSTLNKKSITDAVNKLQELNEHKNHLPLHFISGIVFFELREKNQSSCKLAEDLFRKNIHGYFGGLILRSENLDPNLTGYYDFHLDSSDTIDLPLVKNVGSLEKDAVGNVQLSQEGSCVRLISLDNIWNYDLGYSPPIKNINLIWSYNSFPKFFLDLIERLQGTYDPSRAESTYGLSFEK